MLEIPPEQAAALTAGALRFYARVLELRRAGTFEFCANDFGLRPRTARHHMLKCAAAGLCEFLSVRSRNGFYRAAFQNDVHATASHPEPEHNAARIAADLAAETTCSRLTTSCASAPGGQRPTNP